MGLVKSLPLRTLKQNKLENRTQENLKVLFALMAQGVRSDKSVAKALNVSNATIFRRKKMLEQEGFIKEYTILPDFFKIGIEFIVVTIVSVESETMGRMAQSQIKEVQGMLWKFPEILWIMMDRGMGATNFVIISAHRNYQEYLKLSAKIREDYAPMLQNIKTQSYMFYTGDGLSTVKPLSFRNLKFLLSQPLKNDISVN